MEKLDKKEIIAASFGSYRSRKKKKYFDKLDAMRSGYPEEMTLKIHQSDAESQMLEIDAVCLPIMYNKMGQSHQFSFPKSSVEDAQRLCKEFMEKTMCILNAKPLIAPYIESRSDAIRKTEFLFNTPSESNINKKAHELIANSKIRIQLVGWIDREFLGDLANAKGRGVEIKVITKSADASDKIIKDDFGRLLKNFDKNSIRINPRFHDRFLICDNTAIIGSMYFVDASKTRYESDVFTDDENVISGLINHFKKIWDDANSKSPQ